MTNALTARKKVRLALLPMQCGGALAVLTQLAHRLAFGHQATSTLMTYAMWSGVTVGFLVLAGAAIQEHLRARWDAGLNAALGLFFIVAAAYLAPFIAS